MNSNHFYNYATLILTSLLLTLTGCSSKPWQQTAIPEIDQAEYRSLISELIEQNKQCESKFDAETTISLTSGLQDRSIKGYLAVNLPNRVKFIVSTPLGQPLYIATVNDRKFQAIDVNNSIYHQGTVTDLVHHFDLPEILKKIDIGLILDNKLRTDFKFNHLPRQDKQKRGIWFSSNTQKKSEHILIDPARKLIIEKIIEDNDGNSLTINYSDYKQLGSCLQPNTIHISGLSYGAEIDIQLHDILSQPLQTSNDFTIKIPPGFIKQPLK